LDVLFKGSDFNIDYISVFEVKPFVDKLNPNKSVGLDFIVSRVNSFYLYHQPKY